VRPRATRSRARRPRRTEARGDRGLERREHVRDARREAVSRGRGDSNSRRLERSKTRSEGRRECAESAREPGLAAARLGPADRPTDRRRDSRSFAEDAADARSRASAREPALAATANGPASERGLVAERADAKAPVSPRERDASTRRRGAGRARRRDVEKLIRVPATNLLSRSGKPILALSAAKRSKVIPSRRKLRSRRGRPVGAEPAAFGDATLKN
jgi:hypothetical protein